MFTGMFSGVKPTPTHGRLDGLPQPNFFQHPLSIFQCSNHSSKNYYIWQDQSMNSYQRSTVSDSPPPQKKLCCYKLYSGSATFSTQLTASYVGATRDALHVRLNNNLTLVNRRFRPVQRNENTYKQNMKCISESVDVLNLLSGPVQHETLALLYHTL